MKRVIAAVTAAVLLLNPITSLAAIRAPKEPSEQKMTPAELNGYTEQRWAQLNDNILEYEEIRDLIHLFNPDMDTAWNQMDDNARDIKASVNLLLDARDKTKDMYKDSVAQIEILPIPDEQKKAAIAQLEPMKQLAEAAAATAHQFNQNYLNMQKKSASTRPLYQAEDSAVYGVQTLMAGYKTVEANLNMLKQLVDMYQENFNAYRELQEVGQATATDVLKAQADLVSAKSNYAKLKATEQQLYNQLITLCGWPAGAQVKIGDIPVPDQARVDVMNPDADADKAANSNADIKSLHSAKRSHTSAGLDAYFGKEEEMKAYARANLKTVYANVEAERLGYEAACAGREAGRLSKKQAETMYKQGLTSKTQYLGTLIEAVQKEAAYTTAVDNYEQAILDYEAALRGSIDAKL